MALAQRRRDVANGLNTAGFVSGYRGSPLARIDREFRRCSICLLHTTSCSGPASTRIWQRRPSGVPSNSASSQAHATTVYFRSGTARAPALIAAWMPSATPRRAAPIRMEVCCCWWRDHGAVSSTLPHQSEHNLISAMVPMLSPGGVGEFIDYGLLGWAMSRYSGSFVGFKCQTDIVESTASVDVDPSRPNIVTPDLALPQGGLVFDGQMGRRAWSGGCSSTRCLRSRRLLALIASIGSRRPQARRGSALQPPERHGSICRTRSRCSASSR